MNEPAIELRGLQHRYDTDLVLRGVDLRIEHGEVFGFLGHNGAGKTTAMNILTTLITPTAGTAAVCGYDVVTERSEVTRRIGYLPADVRMYGHMSALENLEFLAKLSGLPDARAAAMEALEFLGCADLAKRRVGTFSTGMRQRIGIAQAIVHRPHVLLLDEPTSGLDPMGVRQLRNTITQLNAELGMTVFMNTHLLSEVSKVCTTIGVLNHGELIYNDSIENTTLRFPDESSLEDIYVRVGGPTP
ncbi:multidrug ABC transporter ATP-binding protein [Nocardioides szechwanensis]|nr:ABC transporter ATP-binding protein [Nocardioides szechwanensis]GEP35046.1 multidrug ABC transporter ATP-binding protein [Nocardioides szechwanensis]